MQINALSQNSGPQFLFSAEKALPRASAVQHTSQLFQTINEFFGSIPGVGLGCVPSSLIDISTNCKSLLCDPPKKKINATLDLITGLKEIGEGIAAFAEYLIGLKAISESSSAWAGPFGLVMTALSIASIARKAMIWKETDHLLKEFDAAVSSTGLKKMPTTASLHAILKLIENKQEEDSNFVSDVFNVKPESFAEAMVDRERLIDEKLASDKPEEQESGRKLLAKTIKSLRGRVQKNIISSAVSIVASVVNMIGSIVIFCCPIIPLGWGLVGASAVIDIGRLVYHKATEYLFAQAIGLKRSTFEWITC